MIYLSQTIPWFTDDYESFPIFIFYLKLLSPFLPNLCFISKIKSSCHTCLMCTNFTSKWQAPLEPVQFITPSPSPLTSPCSTLSVNGDNKTIFLCHPVILQSHTDICNWAGICSHVWHVIPLNHLCCNICDWFVSLPHHTLDIPWKEWWPSLSYRILRWH